MKIDRRNFLAASSSALVLAKSQLAAEIFQSAGRIEGREVAVYTTADKTNHRLSVTNNLKFKPMAQPLETQVCVFVDPTKTFETFLRKLQPVRAEGVRLDDLRARLRISAVNLPHQIGRAEVELIVALVDEHAFRVEHRAHRTVEDGDARGIQESLHGACHGRPVGGAHATPAVSRSPACPRTA